MRARGLALGGRLDNALVFDTDGPLAEQTRRKVYDMASADKMLIHGYHFIRCILILLMNLGPARPLCILGLVPRAL